MSERREGAVRSKADGEGEYGRSGVLFGVLVAAAALAVGAFGPAANAATLCVNPGGIGGCMSSIVTAVGAAQSGDTIMVAPGTYTEGQTIEIDRPLSLVGEDRDTTIIDATGQVNGIYVNGFEHTGLSGVTVTGFTVENADNEGILVTNASNVTISDNRLTGNDASLVSGCPTIRGFETMEDFDCGEAIHFSGVTDSTASGNIAEHNAGGILLSDDTGATRGNTIARNTTQDNPYDCGITLASHPYYINSNPVPGPPTPGPGVSDNTISGNVSRRNGLAIEGAGAGVGIFASSPGTAAYGNTVMGNRLEDNGLPGVAVHGHTPGQNLDGNVIMRNQIAGNGADTEDAATPGPTGINIFSVSPIAGTVVSQNMIVREAVNVAVSAPSEVAVQLNRFVAKTIGVANLGGGDVDASQNWWGCSKGPGANGCAAIQGDVDASPWLTKPFGN